MALFGGSKRTTSNSDNRVINDYGNASWDSSVTVDNSVKNVLDGGAIEGMLGIADNAMGLTDNVMGLTDNYLSGVNEFSAHVVGQNTALASQVSDMSGLMLAEGLSFGSGVLGDAAELVNSQGERNINAAMRISEVGYMQNQDSMNLANDLFQTSQAGANSMFESATNSATGILMNAQEAALIQQQDNNNALENGFKSSMQFVEDFSRSDGADLAKTNMQTVGFLVGGLVLSVMVYKWGK
jgi:hypothetical protein